MPNYIEIPILEAAYRCGIQLDPKTLGRVEVQGYCPFCEGSSNHLYLNTKKDRWYCQKCGSKGNTVSLYAQVHKMDNKSAFEELTQDKVLRFYRIAEKPKRQIAQTLATLEKRHDVYYDLLKHLPLSAAHEKNLLNRGLSKQRIEENMYRTMPSDWRQRRELAGQLAREHDLKGIPGFFTRDGSWSLWGKAGIIVPVLTKDGFIQGIQIRLDDADKRKYRWLSSNPEYLDEHGNPVFENGTRAYSWIHVTGDTTKTVACITEGGLKGDVASFLRQDALFVCVAGAGNIEFLVDTLKELNVKKLVGCYDMDQLRNENVASAVRKMEKTLMDNLGIAYEPFAWNPEYNGIDDFLYARARRLAA